MEHEIHLFILWEKSTPQMDEIITDIEKKFTILEVIKVKWTRRLFTQNLSRFYGMNLSPRNLKEKHCGSGPFHLVIVKDVNPKYEERKTSRGMAVVNSNVFDAKQLYRDWTGGGHRIHGTNSQEEAEHNIALLLDKDIHFYLNEAQWNGMIEQHEEDIVGANGWWSMEHLLTVLNRTTKYVILRNYEGLPHKYTVNSHGDVDLLTNDLNNMALITNGKKVFPKSYRVHYKVKVANEDVYFDFRYVGDNYYDSTWEESILENRIYHPNGFYIPNETDYFYSLLYHALVHKRKIAEDYKEKLIYLSNKLDLHLDDEDFKTPTVLMKILESYLREKGYRYTKPKDRTVFVNRKIVGYGLR
ncbi:hypothetical protein J2S74_002749 [Evansella vedderi]|uniref:Uncharacterized protein n=1 Tax=Evansella vedderi TaxID=38282 RepID=A0ABT9ZVW4_9BACI|nr:hypothetical protein [Evansella vedderi]MDQ0255367.1 hypothetical protein [Evansella vedderi]